MERDVLLVCTVIGFLGSIAIMLGFVADAAASKSSVTYDGENCINGSTTALGCGILGALLVLVNQVTITVSVGCCCSSCYKKRQPAPPAPLERRKIGVVLFVFSWILVIIAVGMFIAGISNSGSSEEPPISRTPSSYTCKPPPELVGLFSMASLSSLIAVALGIASYILLQMPSAPLQGRFGQEVSMGQVQFQPPPGV